MKYSSRNIMLIVAACLLPGLALEAILLSFSGVLLNVGAALVAAVITESVCLRLAGRPTSQQTHWTELDPAALVTALILAAAMPPGAAGPAAFATILALGLGKHAYGGLGNNVFNPAMVGYAMVLVSFPAAIADWPSAAWPGDGQATDALTGATALTTFKYRGAATVQGIWSEANGFGWLGGLGYEWIGLTFLAGGAVLFKLSIAAWRPCVGMLLALTLLSLAFHDNGSSASLGSPAYHLFSGSTLLAACFVATDPVSHPTSARGQWLFGILVGSVTFVIRAWGNYPDGIAFAILLGNALTPYLDRRLSLAAEPPHG